MKFIQTKGLYRIVEHSFKTDYKDGIKTVYFVQKPNFFGKFKDIMEWQYNGWDTYLTRKEFDTKEDAISYVKWLRTPLPKDKNIYI